MVACAPQCATAALPEARATAPVRARASAHRNRRVERGMAQRLVKQRCWGGYSGAAHPDGGVCGEDEDLQRSALRGGGMKKGVWEALGVHPPEGFGRNKDSGPGAGVRGEHGSTRQATAHARACTAGTASGAGPYDVRHEPEVVHRFVRLFIIVVPATVPFMPKRRMTPVLPSTLPLSLARTASV